jgi:ATP-dependent Clp protease adaptor protein ClpS
MRCTQLTGKNPELSRHPVRHPVAGSGETGGSVLTERRVKAKRPALYKVILHNDDFTPTDFVVVVLEKFFRKPHEEATQIMWNVHYQGFGVCGVFPKEIAETKVAQVSDFAREHEHPLKCSMELA